MLGVMKIRAQKREGNQAIIEAEEDYSRFEEAAGRALAAAGREIKLPGFRSGKAPREMVERAIDREYIEQRAAQNLISEIYPKMIDEAKIDPVDYPKVEILQQEKGKPFVFKIAVEVYPEVKLGKYKGLKVEKRSAAVAEEEILKVLGNLEERFSGPLDDEFARKVSRFGTLAELKEEIRQAAQKEKAAEAEADLKNQLVAAASAEAKVEIPPAMVEREIDVMLDELKTSLDQSNLTLEDYLKGAKKEEKAMRDEMRKSAEIRVRGKVVLKAVAEAEKIKVTTEEMQAEFKSLAESSETKPEEIEKRMGESGRKYVEEYLLRKKSLDFLVEKASIKEAK